jgi:xanthine dehydrogenase YagS FAD-binding subunit
MVPYTFIRVQNEQAALEAVSNGNSGGGNMAKFIGGGTNLVDLMKFAVENPTRIIDINGLPLDKIERLPNGGVRIGSLVRNSDLAYDPVIKAQYPLLSQALLSGASPQLRNMATVGGNLLQRTRCSYFYDIAFPCNKRVAGSGCPAINGYNRSHAILGASESCIATHPSDMCVALAALDAVIHVRGSKGARQIPFAAFHLLPGTTPEKETSLNQDELIVSVDLPAATMVTGSCYLKVRDRASYEFALASAAVLLDIRQGNIRSSRVALGGVGTRPWRSPEAEKILTGASAGEETYRSAAEAALTDARPQHFNAFKIELAKRTLVSALTAAGGIV